MSGKAGRLRVAVVFGGRSAEHAISCVSAGSIIGALDPERYEVVSVGIATDGRWVLADGEQRMAIADGSLPEVTGGTAVSLVGDPEGRGFAVLEPGAAVDRALPEVDVVDDEDQLMIVVAVQHLDIDAGFSYPPAELAWHGRACVAVSGRLLPR